MVDPSKNVPDLSCEVQDLLLEVVDLKQEVPDLRSGGIHPNLTPAAALLVTGARRCDHITPVLRQLHWLPVRQYSGARFTKYLTTILRLSYDNANVTIDLRRTSNLQNILQRAQGFS